ncbi:uncharacterized protein LOC144476899 [Augochlora pura]
MNNSTMLIMYCQVTALKVMYIMKRARLEDLVQDRLLECTSSGDLRTRYGRIECTRDNNINDDIPSTSTGNTNMCIENQGVPTYSAVECTSHHCSVIFSLLLIVDVMFPFNLFSHVYLFFSFISSKRFAFRVQRLLLCRLHWTARRGD